MTDLSDGAKWQKIYDQFHVAQPIFNKLDRHYPILPVVVPSTLDYHTIAISCKPTNPKSTWRFGGKAYPLINVSGSDIGNLKRNRYYAIGINEPTEINFSKVSDYYKILIEVPRWFVDAYIQVWVFTGQQPVDTVEQKVDQIQAELVEIEDKIDGLYSS